MQESDSIPDVTVPAAARQRLAGLKGLYIDGQWRDQGSAGTFDHICPIDGVMQARVPLAGESDVEAAITAARAAAPGWRRFPPDQRAAMLHRLADLLAANDEVLGQLGTLEIGWPLSVTQNNVQMAVDWTRYYAGWCDKIEGELIRNYPTPGINFVQREPYGVIGVILTWNGTLSSAGMKVIPALAAGNAVVVKSPEVAPFAMMKLAELCEQAGFPRGVVNIIPGGAVAGAALVAHPGVDKITFTGGISTARSVIANSAHHVRPLVLELGGKSAAIVFEDAEVEKAIPFLASFALAGSGQACILPTRILIHESVYEKSLEILQGLFEFLPVGDPFHPFTWIGPVVNEAAVTRILGIVEKAKAENAGRLLTGGVRLGEHLRNGCFIKPALFVDVRPDSSLFQNEVFGPVVSITPFKTEAEALALANSTRYGLYSYVYTRDIGRAVRLSEGIEAGTVVVNDFPQLRPMAPFGGFGSSGYGKEGGRAGLEEFLRAKTVFIAERTPEFPPE